MDEWIAKLSTKIAPDSDEDIVTQIYTMLLGGSLKKGRSFLRHYRCCAFKFWAEGHNMSCLLCGVHGLFTSTALLTLVSRACDN